MLQYVNTYPINSQDNTTFQPVIRLTMHPAVGGFPSAWEFTLIIVVALLAISFLASVGMHWHLWRIRRRQRAMFENGLLENATPIMPQKKTIEPASLALFPTRMIGDTPPLTRVESSRSERSSKAIENAETLVSATLPVATTPNTPDDVCVICLDEFVLGEQVRKLPCDHEYHCECIGKDKLLTLSSVFNREP
ncbi:uncharacterized protein B0P05DRAFT_479495 [Gilbertella persicaria]|uniref:uncharacterized protein n=1 Tax=Gilbertella persicaria TaxID=101096 RepID=UPI00221F8F88|nr:uncharacterized protein B0P05DRAFT_479495 [Gilbertella persicaria]KAI8054168.1 hypothetical protein B0P05DRAFT_479495 [Gilbertella persicaria]